MRKLTMVLATMGILVSGLLVHAEPSGAVGLYRQIPIGPNQECWLTFHAWNVAPTSTLPFGQTKAYVSDDAYDRDCEKYFVRGMRLFGTVSLNGTKKDYNNCNTAEGDPPSCWSEFYTTAASGRFKEMHVSVWVDAKDYCTNYKLVSGAKSIQRLAYGTCNI